jgi:hypothetical protein
MGEAPDFQVGEHVRLELDMAELEGKNAREEVSGDWVFFAERILHVYENGIAVSWGDSVLTFPREKCHYDGVFTAQIFVGDYMNVEKRDSWDPHAGE